MSNLHDIKTKGDYEAGQAEYEETQDLIRECAREDFRAAMDDMMNEVILKGFEWEPPNPEKEI